MQVEQIYFKFCMIIQQQQQQDFIQTGWKPELHKVIFIWALG